VLHFSDFELVCVFTDCFMQRSRSRSRDLGTKVSVSVARPWRQGFGLGLETLAPRSRSRSRDLGTKVSVSASRPWHQGLGLGLEFLKKVLPTTLVISGLAVAGRYTNACYCAVLQSTCVRQKNKNEVNKVGKIKENVKNVTKKNKKNVKNDVFTSMWTTCMKPTCIALVEPRLNAHLLHADTPPICRHAK